MSPPANENRSTTGGDTPVTSPPTPDEWKQLEPLVDALLDAPIAQRDTLLSELSGGDHARRLELERLVAECERLYPLLDDPPAKRFAAVMEAESPLLPELLAGR